MRREMYCEGCGVTGFLIVESYAAVDASDEIEVAVWVCTGCGARTEATDAVAIDLVEETVAAQRVA
jgi:NADH:ubiquinone oxidoreductase subunit B-like Fe-S oxidoreductase